MRDPVGSLEHLVGADAAGIRECRGPRHCSGCAGPSDLHMAHPCAAHMRVVVTTADREVAAVRLQAALTSPRLIHTLLCVPAVAPAHTQPFCAAPVRFQTHQERTRALLASVADANAPLFCPADALEAERELSHCVELARLQLAELGPADASKTAEQLRGYKDALLELARARPVFKPCASRCKLPLVRFRCSTAVGGPCKLTTVQPAGYLHTAGGAAACAAELRASVCCMDALPKSAVRRAVGVASAQAIGTLSVDCVDCSGICAAVCSLMRMDQGMLDQAPRITGHVVSVCCSCSALSAFLVICLCSPLSGK
jgi:hypothetical protein